MSHYLALATLVDVLDGTQLAMDTAAHTWKSALFDDGVEPIDPEAAMAYAVAPFNANEVAGGSYVAGGVTFVPTLAIQAGTQRMRWNSAVIAYTAPGAPFRYALHYDDTLAGNQGLCVVDIGELFDPAGADVNLTPQTNGWWRLRGISP